MVLSKFRKDYTSIFTIHFTLSPSNAFKSVGIQSKTLSILLYSLIFNLPSCASKSHLQVHYQINYILLSAFPIQHEIQCFSTSQTALLKLSSIFSALQSKSNSALSIVVIRTFCTNQSLHYEYGYNVSKSKQYEMPLCVVSSVAVTAYTSVCCISCIITPPQIGY